MNRVIDFLDRNWNFLALGFCFVVILCVTAKKVLGYFADTREVFLAFYMFLALLSIPCRKIPQIPEKYWYPICLGALAFPFFCFLLGSLGFLIGISLTKWHGIAALLLAVGILWKLSPAKKVFVVNLLVVVGLWLGCLGMASLSRDRANGNYMDGHYYHKPGIIFLAEGWNPVWQPDLASFIKNHGWSSQEINYSHTAYFPKGQWVIGGITYCMTGIIDAGDYVNLLLIIISIPLFYHLLRTWLKSSSSLVLLAAFLLALNVVAVEEINTGMIDGNLGLCFLFFLLSSVVWLKTGEKKWLPVMLGSAIYGCTLKHTAPVYFGIAGISYSLPVVWDFFQNRISQNNKVLICGGVWKKSQCHWWLLVGTIFIMVILCGWNPYVTNTWNHASPFYPLHTFDEVHHPKEDILAPWYQEDNFRNASPWQRFVYTILIAGQTSHQSINTTDTAQTNVNINDLDYFPFYSIKRDHRSFFLLLVFSLSLLFLVKKWEYWLVIGTIILTILVQPHSWWERFIPQMFALPVLIWISLHSQIVEESPNLKRRWTMMTSALLVVLLTNNSWVLFSRLIENANALLLEAREVELLQSPDLCYITCGAIVLDEVKPPSFTLPCKYLRVIHFYNQYYIHHLGFEEIKIRPIKEILLKEQDILLTYLRTYIFTKKENKPLNKEWFLKTNFSELPQALKVVGQIRWRQFCQAWSRNAELL